MGKGIALSLIVATSTPTYRDAALEWKAVAELRLEKNRYLTQRWDDCLESKNAWQTLAETREVKKETPDWVWPTLGAIAIIAFSGGVVVSLSR